MTHLLSSLWSPLDSAPVWTCDSLHGAQGGERDRVRDKIAGFPANPKHPYQMNPDSNTWSTDMARPAYGLNNQMLPQNMDWNPRPPTRLHPRTPIHAMHPRSPTYATAPLDPPTPSPTAPEPQSMELHPQTPNTSSAPQTL